MAADALFSAAYAALAADADPALDARLRALFPTPPQTLPAFLAAMKSLQLSPTPSEAHHALDGSFSPVTPGSDEQQSKQTPFAAFRRGFAYAAYSGLSDLSSSPASTSSTDASSLDPAHVAAAVAKLRRSLEEALLRAERAAGTPKGKQSRPRRSSLLLSPARTEDFYTPRESLRDEVETEAEGEEVAEMNLPESRANDEEEQQEQDIWYTPRAERTPAAVIGESMTEVDSPSPALPGRLRAGVASDAVEPIVDSAEPAGKLARVQGQHPKYDSPRSGDSPDAALPQRLLIGVASEPATSWQGDIDSQRHEGGVLRQGCADQHLEEGMYDSPTSSAATHLEGERLSEEGDDPTVSEGSLDGALPMKLQPGVASAPAACETGSGCEVLGDARGLEREDTGLHTSPPSTKRSKEENAVPGQSFNEGLPGRLHEGITSAEPHTENIESSREADDNASDREGEKAELRKEDGTAVVSETSPACAGQSEEDSMSGESLDGDFPAKLHAGVTSTVSPVDIKACVEPDNDTQDRQSEVARSPEDAESSETSSSTLPDIVGFSDDDKENTTSGSNFAVKLPERPHTGVPPKTDVLADAQRQSQMADTAVPASSAAQADSPDRRRSCTLESGCFAEQAARARATGSDAGKPIEWTVQSFPMDQMAQEARAPNACASESPALTADACGGWSVSTGAASRALEEEIQAGEANIPAWGRSPAGWVAPCCGVALSPGSHFESPVLGSSTPLQGSARKLSFSSSDGDGDIDRRSASTLSLGTRDTLGREVERYVREVEMARERKGAVDGLALEALTQEVSDESDLTPAGFDVVRKLARPSCLVDDAVGSAVSSRALIGRDGRVGEGRVESRLDEVLRAVRESVEVCKEVREELGWRRRARRIDAAVWVVMAVGVGAALCVRAIRAEAFMEVMV